MSDAAPSPRDLVDTLVALLELERIDLDLFRGARTEAAWRRVYGGQVIGQALMAASMTVDAARPPHSLHAYFMRPGDPALPIIYRVSRDRDGTSFASRRVVAIQHGQPILNMAASFHVDEPGLAHQSAMPDAPDPETLEPESEVNRRLASRLPPDRREMFLQPRAIEFRAIDPATRLVDRKLPPRQAYWFRARAGLPDDPVLHRVLLAYASDMMLMGTALLPHGIGFHDPALQPASLDHALWFHEALRVDEWLLYALDSPWSGGARGLNRGSVFTRDGRLVASVAQEGLMRMRAEKP